MSNKKVLFTSHTANFSKFNRPFMRWLKEQGFEVHYASAGEEEVLDCDRHFTVPFSRNPLKMTNLKAFRQLKEILEQEKYDIIHTHTPVGSVITRLAAKTTRKHGTRVIYTAHGFHFFKGAPLLNWLTYYPVEKIMSRYTDTLVTINQEDFDRASMNFYSKKFLKINGVGVDLDKFKPVTTKQKTNLREQLGFTEEDFILIFAAELNSNKNQRFLINQINDLRNNIPGIKLLLCGTGSHYDNYARLIATLRLGNVITLMGYRNDVHTLFQISDICVASSKREGLGLNLVEAMASGLPVVASNNRGHREVVEHGLNGYLYQVDNSYDFKKCITGLYNNRQLVNKISRKNVSDANQYSVASVQKNIAAIYDVRIGNE